VIRVTPACAIPDEEVSISFVRAAGPGGQNVNKVASAAQLRFHIAGSQALSDPAKERLRRLAGRRVTDEDVLIIKANRFRTQARNRDDAIGRLVDLIRTALAPARPRKKTHLPYAAKQRRINAKRRRSTLKATRRGGWEE
jgi:ribosome-associated protein